MACVSNWLLALACMVCAASYRAAGHDWTQQIMQRSGGKSVANIVAGRKNNPCASDTPFPCKTSDQCIALTYVCDHSADCDDGYDEEGEVCTAFKRPPREEIIHFLESNSGWIMDALFKDMSIEKVAKALAVSQTLREFQKRLQLSYAELARLYKVLKAVEANESKYLTRIGMPISAWQEVQIFFHRILKSGFLSL